LANASIQLGDNLADLLGGRLRFILGGHFAGIDFLDYLCPDLSVHAGFKISRQLIKSQIALGLLGPVATNAMFREKSLKWLDGRSHGSGGEQKDGCEICHTWALTLLITTKRNKSEELLV
jgi:hypothetical protein